jgi:hypothetical protein
MDPHELEVLLYPPFTVTNDGVFGGLELAAGDRAILDKREAYQQQRTEMIKKLAPTTPIAPAEDALAAATKKAAASWNLLVGAWAGKTLAEGEVADRRTERDVGPLHVIDRLKLTARVPCKPAPRGGCVELEVTSEPADAAPVRYKETTTLVTDPKTLIPRLYTRRMESFARPDMSQTVNETMTFRCK